jgi:hypothetical protein
LELFDHETAGTTVFRYVPHYVPVKDCKFQMSKFIFYPRFKVINECHRFPIISNPVPRIYPGPVRNAGLGFLQRILPPYSLNKSVHIQHISVPVSVPLVCFSVSSCISQSSVVFISYKLNFSHSLYLHMYAN